MESDRAVFSELLKQISNLLRNEQVELESLNQLVCSAASSLSNSQIESKKWLTEVIKNKNLDLGHVFLCAGWNSILLLFTDFKYLKLRNFDADPICKLICNEIHKSLVIDNWKYLSITEDILNINYESHNFKVKRKDGSICVLTEAPDTIINTSCEHIKEFDKWFNMLPENKLIILQSNNGFQIDEHINCSANLQDFEKLTPMRSVIYSGEKEMPKFTRYMRIGYK